MRQDLMKKHKNLKTALTLALLAAFLIQTAGCLGVNPEKDKSSVVLKISGQNITKGDFLAYYAGYAFMYEARSQFFPDLPEAVRTLKSECFETFVNFHILKREVLAAGKDVEAAKVQEEFDKFWEEAQAAFPTKEGFETAAMRHASSEADLKGYLKEVFELIEYSVAFEEMDLPGDLKGIGEEVAAVAGGVDIPRYIVYYFVIRDYLYYYAMGASAGMDQSESLKAATINAAHSQAYINYANNNNISITDEDIESGGSTMELLESLFGEETVNSFTAGFYISKDQYEAAKRFDAMASVVELKLEKEQRELLTPSDDELKTHYEENIEKYDATVSAYHFLTEDEEFAKQVYDEAVRDGYLQAYERHMADERVDQAIDLGKFTRSEMIVDFATPVFDEMQVGDIRIVETAEYGYHVVYVYEKDEAGTSFEDAREEVLESFKDTAVGSLLQAKLDEIYKNEQITERNYNVAPTDAFDSIMQKKHNIKTYPAVALR
ncbi:MAG: peptidyl-prolyl cis-trans isomerase [Eubacteriaceae bacterium]|nr:peptidyl-prolyl cis-trans isomerase [Eubacteriaceae bacterium]